MKPNYIYLLKKRFLLNEGEFLFKGSKHCLNQEKSYALLKHCSFSFFTTCILQSIIILRILTWQVLNGLLQEHQRPSPKLKRNKVCLARNKCCTKGMVNCRQVWSKTPSYQADLVLARFDHSHFDPFSLTMRKVPHQ